MSMLGRFRFRNIDQSAHYRRSPFAALFIRLVRHGLGAAVGIRSPKELWSMLLWHDWNARDSAVAMPDLTVTEKETT
jgi:hypothetical protein